MAKTMWAVGPDDGEGWISVDAPCEADALRAYSREIHGEDSIPAHVLAQRVPKWDNLPRVSGWDWIKAGLSFSCHICGEMATITGDEDEDADLIDGEVHCGLCAKEVADGGE